MYLNLKSFSNLFIFFLIFYMDEFIFENIKIFLYSIYNMCSLTLCFFYFILFDQFNLYLYFYYRLL